MSICSRHIEPKPDTPHDLFSDWDAATAQAKVAGLMYCRNNSCGFEFYRTILICPACNTKAVDLSLEETLSEAEDILIDSGDKVIDSLYFHLKMTLGKLRRLEGNK
jgi:hypothetical protein